MLLNTSSVQTAAIQDFCAAINVQTPASLSVVADCSPIPHYINVETVLSNQIKSNQFVDLTLLLPKNLDKLPKICLLKLIWPALFLLKCLQSRTLAIGIMPLLSLWGFLPKKRREELLNQLLNYYLLVSKAVKENLNSGSLNYDKLSREKASNDSSLARGVLLNPLFG